MYRWSRDGSLMAASAGRDDSSRAEPFDAIEIRVALLFGGAAQDA